MDITLFQVQYFLHKPSQKGQSESFKHVLTDLFLPFYPCRYMSTLYSHPDFPNKGPKDINPELMKRVSSNPLRLLLPQHITNYIQALWTKKASGQPVTFTDIFGMLIGETLIPAVRITRQLLFVLILKEFLICPSPHCSLVRQSSSSLKFIFHILSFLLNWRLSQT